MQKEKNNYSGVAEGVVLFILLAGGFMMMMRFLPKLND